MAFKLRGTGTNATKVYLQPINDAAGVASRHYEYVTTDTPATVDTAGYIINTTEDGALAVDMLKTGDVIWVYQVASLDDTRSISADKASGITDVSVHIVGENTGSSVDLSDELFGGTTLADTD